MERSRSRRCCRFFTICGSRRSWPWCRKLRSTLGVGPRQGDHGGGRDMTGFFSGAIGASSSSWTGCISRATRAAWRMPRSLAPSEPQIPFNCLGLAGLASFLYEALEPLPALPRYLHHPEGTWPERSIPCLRKSRGRARIEPFRPPTATYMAPSLGLTNRSVRGKGWALANSSTYTDVGWILGA